MNVEQMVFVQTLVNIVVVQVLVTCAKHELPQPLVAVIVKICVTVQPFVQSVAVT